VMLPVARIAWCEMPRRNVKLREVLEFGEPLSITSVLREVHRDGPKSENLAGW
jgi:hypothetical protein